MRDASVAEGIGRITWHSLNERGEVRYCDAKFGRKLIRNIPVSEVVIIKEQVHEHETREERK